MKRWILSMIGILTFGGIGFTVSSAMAIDGPLANATVSFGQWNPNDSGLLPGEVPLDRLIADPGMGRGQQSRTHP